MHSDQMRKYGISESILGHSWQQTHNKDLCYGFRDAILSHLVTIYTSSTLFLRFFPFSSVSARAREREGLDSRPVVHCMSLCCLMSSLLVVVKSHLFPQFFHLNQKRGKVATVTSSASGHWGERRGCGCQSRVGVHGIRELDGRRQSIAVGGQSIGSEVAAV